MTDRDVFRRLLRDADLTSAETAADRDRVLGRRSRLGPAAVAVAVAALIALAVLRPAGPDTRLQLFVLDRPGAVPVSLAYSDRSPHMHRNASLLAASLVSCAVAAETERDIVVDLKNAEAGNVMRLLAQVDGRDVFVPQCAAERRLDMRLESAPPSAAWALLASELDLTLHRVGETTYVQCGGPDPLPPEVAERRVSLDVRHAPTSVALARLAEAAELDGARLEGPEQTARLSFRDVRFGSLLPVAAQAFDLGELVVEDDVLVGRVALPLGPEPLAAAEVTAGLEPLLDTPLPCGAEDGDHATAALVLDAKANVVAVDFVDLRVASPAAEECIRARLAEQVVPGDAAALATLVLPLSSRDQADTLERTPREAFVAAALGADAPATVGCEEGDCVVTITLPTTGAIADLMSRLERGGYGRVQLTKIEPTDRGEKRATLSLAGVPEPTSEERAGLRERGFLP